MRSFGDRSTILETCGNILLSFCAVARIDSRDNWQELLLSFPRILMYCSFWILLTTFLYKHCVGFLSLKRRTWCLETSLEDDFFRDCKGGEMGNGSTKNVIMLYYFIIQHDNHTESYSRFILDYGSIGSFP